MVDGTPEFDAKNDTFIQELSTKLDKVHSESENFESRISQNCTNIEKISTKITKIEEQDIVVREDLQEYLKSNEAVKYAKLDQLSNFLKKEELNLEDFALKTELKEVLKVGDLENSLPSYLKELEGKKLLEKEFESVVQDLKTKMEKNEGKFAKVEELKDWVTQDKLDELKSMIKGEFDTKIEE